MTAGAFSPTTRELVCHRAGGYCERCMAAPIEQLHHRRPRGAGGSRRASTASASNAAALCGPCHSWCESNRAAALREGWLVRQSWEPADVAVFIGGRFVFLTDDGGIQELPEEA